MESKSYSIKANIARRMASGSIEGCRRRCRRNSERLCQVAPLAAFDATYIPQMKIG